MRLSARTHAAELRVFICFLLRGIAMARGRCFQRAAALVFPVAFLVGIGSPTARAQGSDDLDTLNQKIEQLYGVGKYAEAAESARRAFGQKVNTALRAQQSLCTSEFSPCRI
jgi:hypothetical protein